MSIAILCGGRSSRMGEDKSLRHFLGQPLVARVVERACEIPGFSKKPGICLVTNTPDAYVFLGLPMIGDDPPGLGPLGGLHATLMHCVTPLLAVVACDMPFVNATLLTQACEIATTSECNAVVPRSRDGLEPLHAVYRVEACLPVVRDAITCGELSMMRLLSRLTVHEMDCRGDEMTFTNVNTPDEWRAAEHVANRLEGRL